MARRLKAIPLPLALLGVVSLLSFGARITLLGQPCRAPCRSSQDHILVFDEVYYVNAARVIAGIAPPANQRYAKAPLGDDPNAEHPQLGKLLIAGSIELFGDVPLAWRLPSLLLGSLAILGMFALVRAAGGNRWIAVGAATLMAADNLLLVHGRIATLDLPVLALMIWGVALYLRGRWVIGGLLLGLGACIKLVAPYAWLVLVLFELLRWLARSRPGGGTPGADGGTPRPELRRRLTRTAGCIGVSALAFLALLTVLDRVARPYDAANAKALSSSPFTHLAHMLSYGANQTSPQGPSGIASYPWTWMVDYKPIVYLNVNPKRPADGLFAVHPESHFLGMISPAIMLLALPALALAGWRLWRRRGRGELDPLALALAWFVGTLAPFAVLSVVFSRTSYLYYMVIVLPGIYVAVASLLWSWRAHRWVLAVWALLLIASVVLMYPFMPLPIT